MNKFLFTIALLFVGACTDMPTVPHQMVSQAQISRQHVGEFGMDAGAK